jgi:hypothetical protein
MVKEVIPATMGLQWLNTYKGPCLLRNDRFSPTDNRPTLEKISDSDDNLALPFPTDTDTGTENFP